MIQAHHVRLDERLIRLEQRDAVLLDQVEIGQEELGRDVRERLVHRPVELRVGERLLEFVGHETLEPIRQLDARQGAAGYREIGINLRDHGGHDRSEVERIPFRSLGCFLDCSHLASPDQRPEIA